MTVTQMIHSFLLKAKELDNNDVQNLKSFDIVKLFNDVYDIFIDELFRNGDYEGLGELIDSEVVAAAAYSAYVTGITNAISVDLSSLDSYRNYIRSQSSVTRTALPAVTTKGAENFLIDRSVAYQFESNTINTAIFYNPRCFVEGVYLVVIPDGYTTLVSQTVTYLKTPSILVEGTPGTGEVNECELPARFHDRIVDLAIIKANEFFTKQENK